MRDMTKGETSVLDERQVADLLGLDRGKGALFSGFVSAFTAGAGARIALLLEQSDGTDGAALAGTAHALRGSAGNVGAARLAALFERIEAAGRRQDMGSARVLAALVEAEYAAARDALRAACPGNS